MDSYTNNPRYNELDNKIDSVTIASPKWLDKYYENIKDYEPLKYDSRFGMSKKEFDEYLELHQEQGIESSGKEILRIIRDEKSLLISFVGSGKTNYLSDLKIDLINEKVYFKGFELKYFKKVNYKKEEGLLKSDSKGYRWSLIEVLNNEKLPNLSKSDFYDIRFTIVQLNKDGKIMFSIHEREVIGSYHNSNFKELTIML